TCDQIISGYVDSGEVIYVYRDSPLSFHEPKASEAASAANCVQKVAGNEKFFEFSKLYYERTKSNGEGL
ncbi:MAG TPA: thioredoxin domain-containing protein, partial [Candidatus Dojkabacteria bacterium]|nr:thioredoxin domain-containing protein [Candidatus Dojkabacteria bacterium]